jgi:hypothetical protein
MGIRGAKGFQSFHEGSEANLPAAAAARLKEGLENDGQAQTKHEKPTRCASTFHREFGAKPSSLAGIFQSTSMGFPSTSIELIPSEARDPRLPGLTLFFCEG